MATTNTIAARIFERGFISIATRTINANTASRLDNDNSANLSNRFCILTPLHLPVHADPPRASQRASRGNSKGPEPPQKKRLRVVVGRERYLRTLGGVATWHVLRCTNCLLRIVAGRLRRVAGGILRGSALCFTSFANNNTTLHIRMQLAVVRHRPR